MNEILKRNEVDKSQTWDLTSIFINDEAWDKEFEKLSSEIDEVLSYIKIRWGVIYKNK